MEFFQGRVTTPAGGKAFIFLSLEILPELRRTRQLLSDGTFQTGPYLFYLLFNIYLRFKNKVVPFSYQDRPTQLKLAYKH